MSTYTVELDAIYAEKAERLAAIFGRPVAAFLGECVQESLERIDEEALGQMGEAGGDRFKDYLTRTYGRANQSKRGGRRKRRV
jgi:hypothetical protein